MGYAVTSGKYLNHEGLLYSAGAPKGNDGKGKVWYHRPLFVGT